MDFFFFFFGWGLCEAAAVPTSELMATRALHGLGSTLEREPRSRWNLRLSKAWVLSQSVMLAGSEKSPQVTHRAVGALSGP